jgi:hypothetical protein
MPRGDRNQAIHIKALKKKAARMGGLLLFASGTMLCEAEACLALAAVGHEADSDEAQDHHRPGGGLGDGGRLQGKVDNAGVAHAPGSAGAGDIGHEKAASSVSCEARKGQPGSRNVEVKSGPVLVPDSVAAIPSHSVTIDEAAGAVPR